MGEVPPELEQRLTAEPLTAHLATSRDNRPHVAPVWYLYDDGTVQIVTTGRKLADIRANPYVSLSVEKAEQGLPEWTSTLRGTAEPIEDREAFERTSCVVRSEKGSPRQGLYWSRRGPAVETEVDGPCRRRPTGISM
jgi:nitroimidazol reductase NimA-like FMN-containing flavoprotein (pyridoxamine 5'-phosphate oxidase superfamily)